MIVITLALAAAAPALPADTVVGRWRTEIDGGVIEIARCGASICGRIVTSARLRTDPALKDANNKDVTLRGRPLRGLQMMWGFTADGAGVWSGGKVYNAEDGRTYSAKVTPVGPDRLTLRGCVFVPLCKSQTWTRLR